MSRWVDSREDFASVKDNQKDAGYECEKKECPFCGRKTGNLPDHMRACNE